MLDFCTCLVSFLSSIPEVMFRQPQCPLDRKWLIYCVSEVSLHWDRIVVCDFARLSALGISNNSFYLIATTAVLKVARMRYEKFVGDPRFVFFLHRS